MELEIQERQQMDKSLCDLIDIIHFTENVSIKIHGVLDEANIYRAVIEEFAKSKRYNVSIVVLTDDGSKLRIAGTSIAAKTLKTGEELSGLRLKNYRIRLNKSSIYSQVVRGGNTLQANSQDIMGELFSRPLVYLLSKIITNFKNEKSIITPIKLHGKIIGALTMSSTALAEHFIPSVKNLAQHISTALEMADEHAERKKAEEALRKSEEKHRTLFDTSPDGIAIMTLDGKLLDANKSYQDMLGYALEELKGIDYQQLTPKKWHKAEAEAIKAFMPRGYGTFEKEYLRKDGTVLPVSLTGWLMKDKKGNPERIGAFVKDIAERKHMEEALKKSEEKFRGIFENANDCMICLDRSGRILDANRKAVEVFGGSKKEVLKKPFTKLGVLSPRDIPKLMRAFVKGLASRSATLNVRIKNKKGQEIFLEGSASVMNVNDEVVIFVVARDITERKKAGEALEESERKLRDVIDLSSDVIVWIDTTGKIMLVNRKGFETTGLSEKDLIGKNFIDVVALTPESKEKISKALMKRLEGINTPPYEVKIVTKTGEIIPFEISASRIFEGNKTAGVQAIFRDLRERKKMEEKLRQYSEHLEDLVRERTKELVESEKRYAVLVEEASDGVLLIQDGKIVFSNRRAAEIVGYSRGEIIGVPFEKLLDEKCRQRAKESYMRRIRGEELPSTIEVEAIAKTGERVPVEVSATLIHHQGRPADLVIVRNISERKRMEEERLKLEKLAAVGEAANMVGHDLRNPLQSIEIAIDYLNNELPHFSHSVSIPQETMKMLKVIDDSVNYADKIVRDLHDFSANMQPKFKETSINTIIKETLSQVQTPKNVKLIIQLGHLPKVQADEDMIKRVFLNLALNGIQAMEKGGTLEVSTKKTEGFIEVSFHDTGTGITKGDMEKIFTPFFTKKAKGMGLGLAICKRLIDCHGGGIKVESKEGKESTFTVQLPIQQENGGDG